MSQNPVSASQAAESIPNGPGAAAILAAGIGCAVIGIAALATEMSASAKNVLNFYNPAGPLSGKTTVAIVIWLVAWLVLSRLWATKTVAMRQVNMAAFILLALGLVLTFPPVWGFFVG
jgi:hypothetical protein